MSDRLQTVLADPPALRTPERRRRRRFATLTALAILAAPGGWAGARLASGNFGVVQPGQVYRSGQMGPGALARAIGRHRIRTVLNLRGPNPDAGWYRAERAAVLDQGATLIDVSLSSCVWMSRVQAATLVKVLETAERPILIHCQWGSERTGMVSAFAELLRPGGTLADADAQFRLHYLYVPFGDGVVTRRQLASYESWLADRGLPHSPDRFRSWITDGFRPGKPSREDWPYDPYPLVVITPPRTR